MDIDSTYTFTTKFKHKYGNIDFQLYNIQEALERSKNHGVPLFLFLYQEDDVLSSKFCSLLTQDFVDTVNLLIWDVEQQYTSGLARLCRFYLNSEILVEFIENQHSGLFVLKFDKEEEIKVVTMYIGDINEVDFISNLQQGVFPFPVTPVSDSDITMPYVDEDTAADVEMPYLVENTTADVKMPYIVEDATPDVELPCIIDEKINISHINPLVPLLNNIENIGFCVEENMEMAIKNSIHEVKPLLLYIHNDEDKFGQVFWSFLTNNSFNDLFSYFSVYIWNVMDDHRNMVFEVLSELYPDIQIIRKNLEMKKSALYTFSTVNNELKLDSEFNSNISEEDLMFCLYNTERLHQEIKNSDFELIEKQAIVSAIQSFEDIFGEEKINFNYDTVQNCIQSFVLCEPEYSQKILILFYYNENNYISNRLSLFLATNDKIRSELENLFIIVTWDIGNVSNHPALKTIVKNYFDLEPMSTLIDKKQGALFFIASNKTQADVVYQVTDDFTDEDLEQAFFQNVEMLEDTRAVTDIREIKACTRFIDNNMWLPLNLQNKIPLHRVILENCLCTSVKSRKMLLFYMYRNTPTCSKFMGFLKNGDLRYNLSKDFIFLSWDTAKDTKLLSLAIKRNFDLEKMEQMLTSGKTGLFIFIPIAQSLVLFSYMEHDIDYKKLLGKLKDCSDFFHTEQNVEVKLSEIVHSTTKCLQSANTAGSGPAQFHQMMFDQLGDRDYDCFQFDRTKEESDRVNMMELLKKKLYFGMFGPPLDIVAIEDEKEKAREEKKLEMIEKLYKQVMRQVEKYYENVEEVMITCIFNCLVPLPEEKLKKKERDEKYNPGSDFIPFPIFVLRKCVNSPTGNACRIYIDHDFRVYATWENYLENNKLPEGLLITPKDGRYQGDHRGNVRLESRLSPACDVGQKVLNAVDTGSTLLGTAAGFVGVATLIPAIPVAPVVAAGALATGVCVGIYSLVRSSVSLHNRFSHDETMSVANSEARSAYLNLLGGVFGITGSGANIAFAYFIRSGAQVGIITKGVINGVNGMNIFVNGTAVANSAYEVLYQWYQNDEPPSTLTILQLTSSVLFFGHAVYNFQTANTIINETQYQSIREIEASLRSNRHRKTFTKLTKETIRVTGDVQQARAEVISYMKQLDNTDEIFATLTKFNKSLNKNKIRFAVKDGQLNFNGVIVDVADFSNMSNLQRSEYMLNLPSMMESSPKNIKSMQNMINNQFSLPSMLRVCADTFTFIVKQKSFANICLKMMDMLSGFIQGKVIMLLNQFLSEMYRNADLNASFLNVYPASQIPVQVLKMILHYFRTLALPELDRYAQTGNIDNMFLKLLKYVPHVVQVLERLILLSTLSPENTIRMLIKFAFQWISGKMVEMFDRDQRDSSVPTRKKRIVCNICQGTYYK